MVEDARLIDEVVVVGYGSVKKRDLTGAVTSIKSAEVLVAPTSNVMEALQGKIPGMDITKTSGQVGGEVSILLRGSRSIYGNNEPLFIIDGIPGSYSPVSYTHLLPPVSNVYRYISDRLFFHVSVPSLPCTVSYIDSLPAS